MGNQPQKNLGQRFMNRIDSSMQQLMKRRKILISSMLGAFSVYALAREARAAIPFLDSRISARQWINHQHELAQGLRSGDVSELEWYKGVNQLAAEVDPNELLAELQRASSKPAGEPFMRDPVKRHIQFMDENKIPLKLGYAAATFTFSPNNVITPHAHKHMASAHMVIDGKIRVRTYDRVHEEENYLVIRPTADYVATQGQAAAMTTAKDNIHWFTPASETASTFDVIISGLHTRQAPYVIQPLDPLGGITQPNGEIFAPFMSFDDSMKQYGPER